MFSCASFFESFSHFKQKQIKREKLKILEMRDHRINCLFLHVQIIFLGEYAKMIIFVTENNVSMNLVRT